MEFIPNHYKMQATTTKDTATHTVLDLIHALQNLAPAAPHMQVGQKQMTALKQLANIFQTSLPQVNSK